MSSSKSEYKSIGDVIREMLNTYQIQTKFDEASLIGSWEQIVGAPVARRTRKLFMKNKVLFIKLDSPSLKNDFLLNKPHVLELLRKQFGADAIHDLVLI